MPFKIKIGWLALLLSGLPAAAWVCGGVGAESDKQAKGLREPAGTAEQTTLQIPVEVVAKGNTPQWVYVEASAEAVPEPGITLLWLPGALLLWRRRRG